MRKRWAALLAVAVVAGLVVAKRHEFVRFAIEQGAGLASGYTVRVGQQRIGAGQTTLLDVHVSRAGEPLLDAHRIDVRYSLRDLFPGSTHRFGLTSLDVSGAKLTIVKFRDGTYNLNFPKAVQQAPQPQLVDSVPIRFTLRMDGARLELREPYAYDTSAKAVRVRNFNVDASIDTAALTRYRATGDFHERHNEPFTIVGVIDATRGYAEHHAHAARFPLRALANYFADTPAVRILAGRARNFDAQLYALGVEPNVAADYHVNLQLDVDGGSLALKSLDAPVSNIRGHLQLVDNAFFLKRVDASLAGIPLRMTGGIYDLTGALTGAAQLRLSIDGTGDLSNLRKAFTFTRSEPISGRMHLGVLVEGPVDNPVIVAQGSALHAVYRGLPFDSLDAGIVYHDNRVALAPLHAYYGGTQVGIRGTLTIGAHLESLLAVHIVASANRLPYLDEMLGDEPMFVDAAARGRDFLFHVAGAAASARGASRVAALLDLEPDGSASVEPFWLHTSRGDFDGGYLLDRRQNTSGFWALAQNLRMRRPAYTAFPGLSLPQIPNVNGRAVSMTVAGGGAERNVVLAGIVGGADTDIAGVKFDRVSAAFGGTLENAAINELRASGPWGAFDGDGAFSSQAFVAHGTYRGTFEGLQPFLGSAIPAHGAIAGGVSVAVEPTRILVQGSNLSMRGATLRGVPISRASITLGIEGDRLRIYSAHARAAGGDVVAAGSFSLAGASAKRDALALTVARLDAAHLRGIGLPLDAGRLWASGNLAAGAPLPRFDGGVNVAGGRVQGFAIAGGGDVALSGDAVGLHRVVGALGSTYALLDGSIGSLSSGAPAYAFDANVPAGGIARAMRVLRIPAYAVDGSFNAQLHIAGRGLSPAVSGRVGVPAGEVNGLPFVDASAALAAGAGGVSVHHGRVLVGTTYAHFTAITHPSEIAAHVNAARADLADFNNFFDTGDTLAGKGSVKLAIASSPGRRFTTSGDIDVRAFRYRNLPIGDVRAVWSSARNVLRGSLFVGGVEGLLRARGAIAFTPEGELQSMLERSSYDLSADVKDLDLALWVPALGFQQVPITGRASGDIALNGRFPSIGLRGSARIEGGSIGPLTLDAAAMTVHSTGSRITIDSAQMTTPGLTATAGGSLGLGQTDPLDLQVHASTAELPRLVYQLTRVKIPVSGSFESTLQVGGTLHAPAFSAGIDASNVQAYGIPISSLFGTVRLHGRTLVLSDAAATFAKGQATLAGSLPLQLAPLRVGPPNEPMSFDVNVINLDPSVFDSIFGYNTKLGGTIDGHIGLTGTIAAPVIVGHASLVNGSYVSDLEREPIAQAVAALSFDHTSATVDNLAARVGSGRIAGSGRIEFPRGFAGSSGWSLAAKGTAKGAQLNLPAYGSGTLDADVALTKTPSSDALVSGNVALSNATLPFASFLKAASQAPGPTGPPLPLAFDLLATAGKNVRVRGNGYGAGLDIGASGSVRLKGTLAAPTLSGDVKSTGGTLTYFDRAFRVQQGRVLFDPADGVLPTLQAVATANVVNPDPDRARNPYGSADITIKVDGPIQNLKIDLSSNPSGYTRDQIIALLAPFGGFFGGIAFNNTSALQVQQLNGITPLGALAPIPNIATTQRSAITVGQEAFNVLNAQFAAGLLSPVENALGQGLGLATVNLTLGYYGNVGVTATRVLGKAVSAVYASTFGLPQIQSFGLQVKAAPYSSATLSFFYQTGPTKLLQLPGAPLGSGEEYLLGEPLLGNTGFSLTFQHYFW